MIQKLSPLIGRWKGGGLASYPTMPDVEYTETLTFQPHDQNKYIQYEQKTWRTETGEQSHWELGFFRFLEDETLELSNAQSGGRLEIANGKLELLPKGFQLILNSINLSNDPRMVEARREFILEEGQLRYHMSMATQTTPELTVHLMANLTKE